ncbi:MAG: permease-like cell division protein FtsX [Candidatus Margulisbacteria bacterium]|nr:permease-like cell division protein FtsX [Candidatus Margulisiibacteriota bacterium]
MFSNIEFFLFEAFRSFQRGALMCFVAIGTITVSLVIFGLFLLLVINLGNIIGSVSSKIDLAAYVEKDLSLESAGALQLELSRIPGVVKVDFISRTEAWKKFQEEYGDTLALDEIIAGNPLPHTFNIKVRTPEILPMVAKRISEMDNIDEVRYSGQFIEQVRSLIDAVRIGGAALVVLISFATLLIVVNTIRLTVLARETDIYIMKLVGATNTFVKWPFIIEGVILGILGGLSSFLILKFSYDAIIARIAVALPFVPLVADQRLLALVYLVMVLGGTALGMIGAYISVSKVLKAEG